MCMNSNHVWKHGNLTTAQTCSTKPVPEQLTSVGLLDAFLSAYNLVHTVFILHKKAHCVWLARLVITAII